VCMCVCVCVCVCVCECRAGCWKESPGLEMKLCVFRRLELLQITLVSSTFLSIHTHTHTLLHTPTHVEGRTHTHGSYTPSHPGPSSSISSALSSVLSFRPVSC